MVRRILACVLALLVLVETGGIARALSAGGAIECCCGTHSSLRPCHCKDCPVVSRRHPHAEHSALEANHCDGDSGAAGVLVVTALPIAPAFSSPFTLASRFTLPFTTTLLDRAADPQRPPP